VFGDGRAACDDHIQPRLGYAADDRRRQQRADKDEDQNLIWLNFRALSHLIVAKAQIIRATLAYGKAAHLPFRFTRQKRGAIIA
jgi:hypothetical protein